ncbi:hypothetical protein HW932_10695 [Allochromatium humboldtianum]|uniref:Uncharacterized protein n=1 Tax=Allochromatium humboldtianum TaxID=504901 RepID=A0A850R4W4_9GAMM|nr:hypothetical protein [Allochromatium humboldtianum]NVZ09729.1 hypothetical protein [Allochromatium humboldtianum]
MKPLIHTVAGLALLLPIAVSAATLGGYPPEETCRADREASFASGYSQGYSAGESNGFQIGHQAGHEYGINTCVADPLQFGVNLSQVIPPAVYGETEPNDSFITADPLAQGVKFWGQLYELADQDWFYLETTAANQNILVTFSIPEWIKNVRNIDLVSEDEDENDAEVQSFAFDLLKGTPAVWNVSVRDAAGNVFANFNTDVMGGIPSFSFDPDGNVVFDAMTYSVTTGLAGTYYVVVKPVNAFLPTLERYTNAVHYPYAVSAVVQDSPLVNNQPIVGFYDAEVEPNNLPSQANPLANGVTMYGLVNLKFEDVNQGQWVQGEDDWFVYNSKGNELITISFCEKDRLLCESRSGTWYVEVLDYISAQQWERLTSNAESTASVNPLLAFNVDLRSLRTRVNPDYSLDRVYIPNELPVVYRLGLRDPGYYFLRVNHKRVFSSACDEHRFVRQDGEFLSGDEGVCSCANNDCRLPSGLCSDSEKNLDCINEIMDCNPDPDLGQEGCFVANGRNGRPRFPQNCVENANEEQGQVECETYMTLANCSCSIFSLEPYSLEDDYTIPYNFTWHGTQLPPSTIDTDAYEDYLNDRPNPYTP